MGQSVSELFISLERNAGKLSASCEKSEDVGFASGVLEALLDEAYDRETKVRCRAAKPFFWQNKIVAQLSLDKLGDPDKYIKDAFFRLLSVVVPSTVYTCAFLEGATAGSFNRIPLVSMNWRHFAVKQSTRKFQSQQLLTILSDISNR